MIHETAILKSKLCCPPRFESIRRCGRRSFAETILDKRLTTVTAGAGYGKITLIAQALNGVDARLLWYRLDADDGELSTILSYLVTGVREIFPDFGGAVTIDRLGESSDTAEGEASLRWLLAELESCLEGDLVIVLDDFHRVQACAAIKEALNFFLRFAASALHVILISRASIPLALSRLKAQRQLLEITSADLVF